ncbi:SRPBCC family protein [Aegicerativicinus sediminis]|uniref:SRPBCC family protein n=1 Tax=Aegicerativicinus sediminis TaxID=2893202 RepID=UPI001E639A4A|nr:SRPBCC family protein [Aegicerativicinus sediminis]
MTIESPKTVIPKSQEETFKFLSEVENFEKLMPESIEKFKLINEDTFLFALKGMPEITLKKKIVNPFDKIVLGAAEGKIDFTLTGHIVAISPESSEVTIEFDGDFNPMMAMMIKKPIKNFIETLATKLPGAMLV